MRISAASGNDCTTSSSDLWTGTIAVTTSFSLKLAQKFFAQLAAVRRGSSTLLPGVARFLSKPSVWGSKQRRRT